VCFHKFAAVKYPAFKKIIVLFVEGKNVKTLFFLCNLCFLPLVVAVFA
jgi:hypothetical protein